MTISPLSALPNQHQTSGFTAAAATSGTGGNSAQAVAAAANEGLQPQDFMTLLVSQLKNQDPTSPMDPTTFVSQLVQFNSLENLISINQELAPTTPATGSGSGTGSGTGSGSGSGSSSGTGTGSTSGTGSGSSSTSTATAITDSFGTPAAQLFDASPNF